METKIRKLEVGDVPQILRAVRLIRNDFWPRATLRRWIQHERDACWANFRPSGAIDAFVLGTVQPHLGRIAVEFMFPTQYCHLMPESVVNLQNLLRKIREEALARRINLAQINCITGPRRIAELQLVDMGFRPTYAVHRLQMPVA